MSDTRSQLEEVKSSQATSTSTPTVDKPYKKDKKTTSFKDVLYDEIILDAKLMRIVDTAEFQSLRKIKQLGGCMDLFPSANHSRFEHCLGTCHLAGKQLETLRDAQKELGITDRDVYLMRTAGLIHDLGHSMLSHAFDNCVAESLNIRPEMKHHETRGAALFRYMVRRDELDYSADEIHLICSLVVGQPVPGRPAWLFGILANKRNELDVDKLDYINRDSFMLGLTSNRLQVTRIMKRARVINDEICYPAKAAASIMEVFNTRYNLHLDVYNHRVVRSIECMVRDILLAVADVMDWSSMFNSETHEWRTLTDNVLDFVPLLLKYTASDPVKQQRLQQIMPIYNNLQRRQLYPMVKELLQPLKSLESSHAVLTPEEQAREFGLDVEDIKSGKLCIISRCLGLSSTLENPFEHIHCYRKSDPTQVMKMSDLARVQLAPRWPFTRLTHVFQRKD